MNIVKISIRETLINLCFKFENLHLLELNIIKSGTKYSCMLQRDMAHPSTERLKRNHISFLTLTTLLLVLAQGF